MAATNHEELQFPWQQRCPVCLSSNDVKHQRRYGGNWTKIDCVVLAFSFNSEAQIIHILCSFKVSGLFSEKDYCDGYLFPFFL